MSGWTTPADIRARVRRRWDDGSLLRVHAAGEPFPVIEVPLRGPRPQEIGDDLSAVRLWIEELEAGSRGGTRYALSYREIGGRLIGRNKVPGRAVVADFSQAWSLLGVAADVRRFDAVLEATTEPAVAAWVLAHPQAAVGLHDTWPQLLAAFDWLKAARGSGRYVRQIDVPGIDTKFVERNRAVLAVWLGVSGTASGFAAGLGLGGKPELLRMRFDPGLGVFAPLSEVSARAEELADLHVEVRSAVIIENEITYLSYPVPSEGVVAWGRGFGAGLMGSMPWMKAADVHYWGDLDTHGFAILSRLRSALPQTRSFLMDRETLLAFRDRWVSEPKPASARLEHLDELELDLYQDLVGDVLGSRVRLEQERVDWQYAKARFPG